MLDKFDMFAISYLGKSFDELLAIIHDDIAQLKIHNKTTVFTDLLQFINQYH